MALEPSALRRSAASRLRRMADRLDLRRPGAIPRSPAPLIRLHGQWWTLDELARGGDAVEGETLPD